MNDAVPAYRAAGQIVEAAETQSGLHLEPITRMLGGSYALLFRMRLTDRHVEDAACHGVDVGYVSRLRQAGRERMLPFWLAQLEPGSVIDRAAFGSDHQFARTPFFNHVIRPEGRFHCMIATPHTTRKDSLHLIVGRPHHRQGFASGDLRLLRSMLPLVNEVITARAELSHSEAAARSAFGIAEAWPGPLLVASADRTVRHLNGEARRLLATTGALVVDGSRRLRSDTPSNDLRLQQAFAAVARFGEHEAITLSSAAGSRDLNLTLRRSEPVSVGGRDLPLSWVVITVEEQGPGITEGSINAVRRHYDLTARETALLTQLVSGTHLKEVCRQLGMSYNTGRSHLRQIFAKTDTHRQSDLMRLCVVDLPPGRDSA